METYMGRGFSEGDLKAASWWIKNEVKIRFWSRTVLIAGNVLVWGYAGWGMLDAYAISYPRESRITQEIMANQVIIDNLWQDRPQNIGTGQVLVFNNTDKRIDLAVDIQNPNKQWWAEFSYRFNVAGQQSPPRQGFIMPDSLATLAELGFKPTQAGARSGQLLVDNVRWHRVEPSEVGGNYDDFVETRVGGVQTRNIKFVPATAESAARTSFELVNSGAYGFWSVDYTVKLMRGSTVIGINKVNARELKPGEVRSLELQWFENPVGVTKTEIVPVVNLLDPKAYLPTDRF